MPLGTYGATSLCGLITVILLCGFSVFMVIKAQEHLSSYAILWMAIAVFWAVLLFRAMLRIHGVLRGLLAGEELGANDRKSPLVTALGVATEVTTAALFMGYFSVFPLLMAITLILPRH